LGKDLLKVYKALLFLGAGAVIHAVADNQDFRRYGGLRPFLPLTYSVMLIASLSLVAFPFMTGFYSKDFILESAYGQYYFSSSVVYIIATIGAMFTTLYSVKVLYLTFLTNPNGPLINYKQAHEGDIFMSLPLIILAVFSIFFGFITKDMFIGLGSGFFADNALFIHPCHEIMLDTEFGVPTLFKLLPLVFTILLSVISIVLSEYLSTILIYFKLSRIGYNIFSFFNQRFLIELFYNKFITGLILKIGGQTTKVLDKGSIEYIGPYGLEKGLLNISNNIAKLNTGIITSYALYILVGLIFYILFNAYIDYSITMLILCICLVFTLHNPGKTPIFTSLPLQSSFDPAGVAQNLQQIANMADCIHPAWDAITVTAREAANGNIPLCDFNPTVQGQLHPVATQAGQVFYACATTTGNCHAVICDNCKECYFLFILPNVLPRLEVIKKVLTVFTKI